MDDMMPTAYAQHNSLELKKHVAAIHSTNRLTLVQRKIANALLYNAYGHLMDKDEHKIHIMDLCNLIGYDSKDFKKIKNALVALISTVIEWNLVDKGRVDDEGVWNASAIIADASINGPICSYSYSNKMRQLLYRPELYGRLNMHIQAQFKSTYGLALYENCIRYQNIHQTPWFDISTFRKLMGVEEGKYIVFRDFKRRVIDKAVSEVNQHAPICVAVKLKKQGRQVVGLQFAIKTSEGSLLGNEELNCANQSLADRLQDEFGLASKQVERILITYEDRYIAEKILIIESSSSFQNGKIINLAKYLEKALEEDYQPPKSSRATVEKINSQKEKEKRLRKQKEQQLANYRRFQDKEILKLYEQLSAKAKTLLVNEFGTYIQHNIYFNLFKKDGLANILVADRFCDFIRSKKSEMLNAIISFDDFCRTMKNSVHLEDKSLA